ncbi:APH(3')-II family aminoglycoside O-phosphotransferase [Achromobacter sp. UMC46]|uniref:APH(3')-II family aminoglycoside O-phosphotransferase n=1 Tax=Achromobacter sp. UMC46 TaxID=1862319 RepID=UPI001601500E|nr:APH(3') family aminoglycoside O-phosphotransferase [Achromobacter sp. UMC46]MBB1594303.1 APH(3') family aminoglycoside O-phosphotransferase [Achromobacter sp. UMC46]
MESFNATESNRITLPAKWRGDFAHASVEQQSIGESRADVFRVRRPNRPDLFLKSELAGGVSELPDEIDRLRWLAQVGQPAPHVLDTAMEGDRHWLLMTAIRGRDLASAALAPAQIIGVLATALRNLHHLPIETCPFDHRLEARIAQAKRHVDAGLVDEADFDDERLGQSASQVLAELLSSCPTARDPVVAHGDACLPNFMVDGHQFTGFIDCGRLGIADRFQDLALAARSIARNVGEQWVPPFFRAYGIAPDAQRIRFYCLLDEFF